MTALRSPLPERPRTYRFALTPLADAMFQLLVFFMLSTSLAPYSLITLRTASADTAETAATGGAGSGPPATRPQATGRVTLWTLGEGSVLVDGQVFLTDQFADLAGALAALEDPGDLILIVGPLARVQDVADAMAALRAAGVLSVRITSEAQG